MLQKSPNRDERMGESRSLAFGYSSLPERARELALCVQGPGWTVQQTGGGTGRDTDFSRNC